MPFIGIGMYGTGGRGWSPPGTPGIYLRGGSWTVDTGGIAQWNDLSVSGAHATQGTSGNRPDPIQVNGIDCAQFVKANVDYLRSDTLVSVVNGSDTPYTLISVAKSDTASSNGCMLGFGTSTTTDRQIQHQTPSSLDAKHRLFRSVSVIDQVSITSVADSDTGWHVYVWQFSGTTVTFRIDGVGQSLSSSAADLTGSFSCDRCTIGAQTHSSLAQPWNGKLARLLLYPSVISGGDLAAIESEWSALVSALAA